MLSSLQGLAGVVTAVVVLAACSGGDTAQGPNSSGTPSEYAEAGSRGDEGASAIDAVWGNRFDFRVELLTLARTPGDAVFAKFRVTSYEPNGLELFTALDRRIPGETRPAGQLSGVSLVDTEDHRRYLPLTDDKGECLCSQFDSATIPMRQSVEVYAFFPAPPEGVESISIELVEAAELFRNVPLGTLDQRPTLPTRLPDDERQPPRRPGQIAVEPEVEPLISREFDTDSDSASQRAGDESTVHLSAQVLFDLNKATLRDTAEEELQQVGGKIADASPEQVNIDGHTDSTGSPNINIPLSENRAQTVKDELQRILDDDSIDYVAEGHGANQPVADNSTPEGRQANRRVTITFER